MEYSSKGLNITTDTNICKVNTYSFGLDKKTNRYLKRQEEKKRLLQQQKDLLQITKCAIDISTCGFSYRKASKPKSK